ncbi:MAG TPA: helix-turn-helix domain-containing protein [Acidimicrobiales bacterium]|nr:helix-turn-helix domain-containing protein [Acidimicrobiales bacterium]
MPEYGQFCPVSKAADVLCERWAILVVREALAGSARFGDFQRGLPGCPPATLSKRLKDLTRAGVLGRTDGPDGVRYELTEAGWELYPIVEGFGRWGQRWVRSEYPPDELDAEVLLWDVRRYLDPASLGVDQAVVQLEVRVPSEGRRYFWITIDPGEVDLCLVDPGRPVDAVVDADLAALTRVWMGDDTFAQAVDAGTVTVRGPAKLVRRIPAWFGRHPVLGPIGPASAPSR